MTLQKQTKNCLPQSGYTWNLRFPSNDRKKISEQVGAHIWALTDNMTTYADLIILAENSKIK
jgi:hypothetical protein